MKTIHKNLAIMGLASAFAPFAHSEALQNAFVDDAKLSLQTRFAALTREFEDAPQNDRDIAAAGFRLKYETGTIAQRVKFVTSLYHVEELFSSGREANDLLPLNPQGEQEDRFTKFGEAYVELTPFDGFKAKIGRQTNRSLLKSSSGQRSIPDTFQGISAEYKIGDIKLYSQWYNKWSRRFDKDFISFSTDIAGSKIDHIWINGISYKKNKLAIDFEVLDSANYLQKTGVRASYYWQLAENQRFTTRGGVFTSKDSGSLFVVGAESGELDDEDVREVGERSSNDGLGAFIQGIWQINNWKLTTAYSQFEDSWIEDNYSGDHGSNPFPTRSIVFPDFANTNEKAYMAGVEYNWNKFVPGLTTAFNYSKGTDIENSEDASLGEGEENYRELFIRYKPNWAKGLAFQWRIHDYRGKKTGNVDGVKGDDRDHRIFIDYTYKF